MEGKTMEVVPVETQEAAIMQGARLLDHYRPGWEHTVHGAMTDGIFNMANWERCMVGTLELFYTGSDAASQQVIAFNGLRFDARADETRWVGFLPLQPMGENWLELDQLWREQVDERLGTDLATAGPDDEDYYG